MFDVLPAAALFSRCRELLHRTPLLSAKDLAKALVQYGRSDAAARALNEAILGEHGARRSYDDSAHLCDEHAAPLSEWAQRIVRADERVAAAAAAQGEAEAEAARLREEVGM